MRTETSSTCPQTIARTYLNQLRGWHRAFSGIRPRILVWYCLLTTCATLASILVTRQIFCDRLERRAEDSLVQEVRRFQHLVNQQDLEQPEGDEVVVLFNQFLSSYVPRRNEFVFTLLGGQLYKSSQTSTSDFLEKNPNLLKEWGWLNEQERGKVGTSKGDIFYVAQPIKSGGVTRGVLIAVHDSTADYQTGTDAIALVIQVTIVVLVLFSLLAWVTAGRVLSPLRSVTETARSISESDMTQRLTVQGNDEIAELTMTFNEMLDRLQFAFTSQQEFLKDATHELRTPITVIQGHLELLSYNPQKQQETIALVIDELDRMNRLVNDLLLLAKAERPDFLNSKPEELDWLTEELYFKAKAIANRDWRLESKGLSPVVVDRQRLTQAVMNLVQNAVRHTQEGDTITLGSTIRDGYVYFWVRDTGEGIAPEDQKRIFERFVRATKDDFYREGAGLGLSIVEAIAQAHSGWVELSSSLGFGSTFTIVLPLLSAQEDAVDEPDSHRRRQSPHYRLSGNRIAGSRIHYSGR